MNRQAIVKLWVLILATLMSSSAMSQAVIEYKFFAQSYNFHLTGKHWGTIHGLSFDVRQSFGSLLGEPVTNNNVRYWFDGQEGGINKPTIFLHRDVLGKPQTQGLPSPNGDTWAIIELWGNDYISVRQTGGLLKVSYPFEHFIDQARVVSAHFVGNYGQIHMLGGFDGVFGSPGSWGWNFPGSPSWTRALVSSFDYIEHGTRPINWYSQSQARDLFTMLNKECQPVCQGQALRLQDLNLNMHGVLNDIATESEEFRMAYYSGDPRTTLLSSLMSAAQSEPDPELRGRRQALANRAMEAFGDEQSRTFKQQWGFTVSERQQSSIEQVMASIDEGFCQMMTEGKVQENTLGRLQKLVKQEGALPRQLQDRAEQSLKLLGKKDVGVGDLQITLTWKQKNKGRRNGVYFLVRVPDEFEELSLPNYTSKRGVARGTLSQAKAGKYWISVHPSGTWGYNYNYELRIQGGGKVETHSGSVYQPGGLDSYEFELDPNKVGEGQRCQNLTEL
ncbi:hypothetical protein KOI40_02070 [Aestuariicella sp. G3-2]|uniref:hypothetical protein n=1 Tax=Pseudomaricurvus albidus TaxID=2842452 RepID=UPI001C0D43DE|nr:hypothetical protein [Aestuariicella albida]MBU3068584.1 hypothetical protein [Aestuariicella albida]